MIGKFDWNRELPPYLRDQIAKVMEELVKPAKHDKTVELRTRVKVLREILALPDKGPVPLSNLREEHQ